MINQVVRDLVSDVLGACGITTISIPFVADVNDLLKLVCSVGGVVLVWISINTKIILYREIKARNKRRRKTNEKV